MPVRTEAVMGTIVTIHVVAETTEAEPAISRAFGWFHEIEARCSRFLPSSELMLLTTQPFVRVPASPILFEAVRFACMVAEESDGAFDPAIGHRMEQRGFNREHRTGAIIRSYLNPVADVSYRDIELDPEARTIKLRRPLTLDLGAVAKGLAVDTAAKELAPFRDFAIDAGGDLYLGGRNPQGELWSVGIRHPRKPDELVDRLIVSDQAVCTSGDYERGQHILDPRTGEPAFAVASATVRAPGAMLADALATATFVLGPVAGIEFLERMEVDGLMFTDNQQVIERFETRGLRRAA